MEKKINIHRQRIMRLNEFCDVGVAGHELTPVEGLVWICVYRHTQWKTGTATLSYSRIADSCNVSESTVRRALKKLTEQYLIKRLRRGSGSRCSVFALMNEYGEYMPQTLEILKKRRAKRSQQGVSQP